MALIDTGYNAVVDAFFLQGFALGLSAAASPGLFQTFLINQTLSGGWRRSAPLTLAPLISDISIVLTILLLLNRLPSRFLSGVSLAGGIFALYLVWIGWRQWRLAAPGEPTFPQNSTIARPSRIPIFWRAILVNSLSPGPYTFWTLVNGPLLLTALKISAWHTAAFLVGFYGMFITGMLILVAIFQQALRMGPLLVRYLTLLSLIILGAFAIILLHRGISGLLTS